MQVQQRPIVHPEMFSADEDQGHALSRCCVEMLRSAQRPSSVCRRLTVTSSALAMSTQRVNTTKGKEVRACIKLFTDSGLTAAIPHDQATWKTFILKLKLDWVWLRGLKAIESGIVHSITLSDHWPLWVKVRFGGDGRSPIRPLSRKGVR